MKHFVLVCSFMCGSKVHTLEVVKFFLINKMTKRQSIQIGKEVNSKTSRRSGRRECERVEEKSAGRELLVTSVM